MKPKRPRSALGRLLWIATGIAIALANAQGGEFLGFLRPTDADAIGFDSAKLAIGALALWLIYRGVRPAKPAGISN